jgi:hypothetical protein
MVGNLARRWAVVAVAVPLAAAGARRLSHAVEARRGSTRSTRLIRKAADTLQRATGRSSMRKRRGWH